MMKFTFYHQHDAMDCGPACLQMVAKHYGKKYRIATLREKCYITRDGVSLLGISDAAEAIGFETLGVQLPYEQLASEAPLPCIVHWKQRHFLVVYDIRKKRGRPWQAHPFEG
jgi:ATP-binding cassette, subfamily B, bacterial